MEGGQSQTSRNSSQITASTSGSVCSVCSVCRPAGLPRAAVGSRNQKTCKNKNKLVVAGVARMGGWMHWGGAAT